MSVRRMLIVLFAVGFSTPIIGQTTDRLELFAYDPKCEDYVIGYSIGLMAEGRLVGGPSKLCKLDVDLSGCSTALCKVNRQLAAWHDCVAKHASPKGKAFCDWHSREFQMATPALGDYADAAGNSTSASFCFETAASLLRDHMTILLSPTLDPDDQDAALALNLEGLAQLKRSRGGTSGITCGHFMNVGPSFPTLTPVTSMRLMIMARATGDTERPTLYSLIRLAYEEALESRSLPRDLWFRCMLDLEYEYFVRSRNTKQLLVSPINYCSALRSDSTKTAAALRDLQETKQ